MTMLVGQTHMRVWLALTTGLLVLTMLVQSGCSGTSGQEGPVLAFGAIPQVRNCSVPTSHPVQASFFVSTQGNDAWDGTA